MRPPGSWRTGWRASAHPLVAQSIAALADGPVPILPQDKAKVTQAPKLRKEDGLIDWSRPARAVHDHVRAMQPWPVASTTWHPQPASGKKPMRIIVHRTEVVDGRGRPGEVIEAAGDRLVVAAGDGAVRLLVIQLEGKKAATAAEFLRGHRPQPGDLMGTPRPRRTVMPERLNSPRHVDLSHRAGSGDYAGASLD